MGFMTILYEKEEGMAKITFNRPEKLNALNGTMWKEIRSAIEDANEDEKVVAIVITGSGRAFSAGNDISDFEGSIGDGSAEKLIQTMVGSKKPVISAVNGLAFGGGFELVLACDISIVTESSSFSFPEPKLGIFPPFGIWLLPQIIGTKKAKYLMLTCDVIDGKEAERQGLVSRVVPDNQLENVARETVEKIRKIAPLAIGEIKSGIDRYLNSEELSKAMSSMDRLLNSSDFKEGSEAFFDKRTPKFKGR